ncbi:MAG TPA: cupin domain-containing protein [Stellaceae bacterium]|jgi:mannose-6-phosphate isomerase-like protein (cupin superfamily)|nr:cupin domain-containing protein [Stellaceae bacterium]
MPIIPNTDAQEIPWRPGYRNFVLAGREQGLACIAGYSVIEPGAGAPLHAHKDVDEVFILLEGTLDLRLGDEQRLVEANHTIAIPAGVPHAFVAVGPAPVRMFTFMPRNRAIAEATTYFEGGPPAGADQH